MIASPTTASAFREYVRVPWRHKGKLVLFALSVLGAAAAAIILLPRTYRSEAKLLLRLGRENMAIDPTATLAATSVLSIQQTRENEINSVIEILHGRVLVERVINALGPAVVLGDARGLASNAAEADSNAEGSTTGVMVKHVDESATAPAADVVAKATLAAHGDSSAALREAAARQFMKALNVDAIRKSSVVQITYDASSPELAQTAVNQLIHDFLDEYIRLNRTPGAQEFLAQQTTAIRQQLQEKEESLRKLKDETGIAAPDGRRTIVVGRIGRLEDELLQTDTALASAESEVKRLREQLVSLPATAVTEQTEGFPNEAADGMRQQLYTLQLREQELAQKYTNDHPQLRQVRRQIAEAQSVFDQEQPQRVQTRTGVNKPYEEVKLQLLKQEPVLASLHAKSEILHRQLTEEQTAQRQLNADEESIARLQREIQLEEANYRRYVDSLEQARIDQALADRGKSNISVFQPATLDVRPVKPNVLLIAALGLVVGVLGGVGLTFVAESMDDSIRSGDDLERQLDLPVLAVLPRLRRQQLTPVRHGGEVQS